MSGTPATAGVARAGPPPGLMLGLAVLAMSWGGPLVRYATAPALAVAAWRVAFSVLFITVVVAVRDGGHAIRRLAVRDWALAGLSGIFLAGHFWSWIASLSYTTVASSVVLVNTQPIFVALLSIAFLGERPTGRQWAGIGVAVVGAAVIGWGDFAGGTAPLVGDLLAVAGAVFVSLYYVIGRRLRQRLDLWSYIAVVYGVAAAILLGAAAALPGVAVTGYPATDWLVFLALAAGPMMIGHTGVNYALRYVPAYVANLALLGEPVGATLLAWWLPGIRERPSIQLLLGGTLVLTGIALGVRRRTRTAE
ncbi:MAG: EamA family transporter [Gemmatimonadetes bacterium]|nr:DMT family transporter [Gemmatimonadota bacterium]NIQ54449.1 DMT family transporter [Gemmatimonadota bacterium]NIU74657.1 EamA family transporter [Gammaproteobacteria bacterium]NIX44588.1 EamA family transporter [Gemmatimonadota bacterium]NIY08798.1 EamA family transporter [Gemmatimonadota bacterium]